MSLSISLLPDIDGLDLFVIEQAWLIYPMVFAIAIGVGVCVIADVVVRHLKRSPVEKVLKRRRE